jgi:muconolactone delta-isomerase
MEFLVQFDIDAPSGASPPDVDDRLRAEAAASSQLAEDALLVRLWRLPSASGETHLLGLYRAETDLQLDERLHSLPFADWTHTSVTQLEAHPRDPASGEGVSRSA